MDSNQSQIDVDAKTELEMGKVTMQPSAGRSAEIRSKGIVSPVSAKLGFTFAGQGSQWPRRGLDLMVYPVFSKIINNADVHLKALGAESC